MSDGFKHPAPRPCVSCPYRCDVPSGVWELAEYAKLPRYDLETWQQPTGMFGCHQADGKLCAGWVATIDVAESFAVRLALAKGALTPAEAEALDEYETDIPLFESGRAAAEHGCRDWKSPGRDAIGMITKMEVKRSRTDEEEER